WISQELITVTQDTTFNRPEDDIDDENLSAEERELVKAERERVEILEGLAKKIEDAFQERVIKRKDKELEWNKAQALYDAPLGNDISEYDGPFNGQVGTTHKRPEPNIVRTKCDTAVANSISLQFGA